MPKSKAAMELGQRGGKARAKALTPAQRKEIAKKAAVKRWTTAMEVHGTELIRRAEKNGVVLSDKLAMDFTRFHFESAMNARKGKPMQVSVAVRLAERLAAEQPDGLLPSDKVLRAIRL